MRNAQGLTTDQYRTYREIVLYTIGRVSRYERAVLSGICVKLAGGWVWRTKGEAEAYLAMRGSDEPRAVYGVLAEWEIDAQPVRGEPTRRLVRDAIVVRC